MSDSNATAGDPADSRLQTEIYARADAEAKRRAIENAYEPLTPDALPDWTSDWTSDSSLLGWLDSLGR